MEKDVVLKIARKLEWLLNNRKGYRAFLTRNGDYYPSFNKRLQIAQEYGADLFISIHADASRSRQPYGSSVYCLSTKRASSEAARLLARQENLADIVGGSESEAGSEESDPITLDMIQTETINLSKSFGTTILEHLKRFNAIHFPRIQEAPFIVLKLPHIPSILVETGYVSNPKEELLLRNNRHQNRIALALCTSIQDFLHSPEQDKDAVQIALEEDREDAKTGSQSVPPQQEPESRPLPRMVLYKVKKGDTLDSIAKKFDTSPASLMKLNHLQKAGPLTSSRLLKVYLPAGNGAKIRTAPAPAPAGTTAKPVFHRVKRGESLLGIARKYGVSLSALASENRIKPEAPLLIGRNLKIPSSNQPEQNAATAPSETSAKPRFHIVRRGETLEKIGRKYNVSVASLLKENNMKLKDSLWVDRKIRIP